MNINGVINETGPYETRLFPLEDFSDESFESTDESDANIDYKEPPAHESHTFHNMEVVWVKRAVHPWFPGIVTKKNFSLKISNL